MTLVVPLTVAPLAGAVMDVAGGVVSPLLVVSATETSSMRNVVGSDESVAARKTSCSVCPL